MTQFKEKSTHSTSQKKKQAEKNLQTYMEEENEPGQW